MKTLIIILALNCSYSLSQNYLTRGDVFDFEVGDVIERIYDSNYTYGSRSYKIYLGKSFSTNNDTVFYLVKSGGFALNNSFYHVNSAGYAPNNDGTLVPSNYGSDTIIEFYTNLSDTIKVNQLPLLYYEDSCANQSDSLYFQEFDNNCTIVRYDIWTDPLAVNYSCAIEFPYFSMTWIKGLGVLYWESFYNTFHENRGLLLTYFKKGNLECGVKYNGVPILLENEKTFELWPNPATDQIEIKSDYYYDSYQIMSIDGLQIQSKSLSDKLININELNAGVYFIALKLNGQVVARKRFNKI